MTAKRLVVVVVACGLGLPLGACSSVSGFVADSWPHFAGGEPNDTPPRPGSPGYSAYIAHGQEAQGAATPAPNQQAAGGVTPEFAARQPGVVQQAPIAPIGATASTPVRRPVSPAPQGGPEQNVGQGGLY